jgi:hypothetical protein
MLFNNRRIVIKSISVIKYVRFWTNRVLHVGNLTLISSAHNNINNVVTKKNNSGKNTIKSVEKEYSMLIYIII